MFLFPEELDGPTVITRILRNAPDIWLRTIKSTLYMDIFSLKAAVVLYRPTLMGNWNTVIKLGTLNQYYPRRRAHAAEIEDYASEEEEEEIIPEVKDAHTAPSFNRPRGNRGAPSHAVGPSRGSGPSKQADWPEGKTVKGYAFVKRDDVHSDCPPPGNCYICTSPNHYARNCPHYGTWISMRDANLLDTEVDSIQEAKDLKNWLVMMVEVNGSESTYGCELAKLLSQVPISKDAYVVDARTTGALATHLPPSHNRNGQRREEAERAVAARCPQTKGKSVETSEIEVKIPCCAHQYKDQVARELNSRQRQSSTKSKIKSLTSPPADPTPVHEKPR
jgi:hypothetical protein